MSTALDTRNPRSGAADERLHVTASADVVVNRVVVRHAVTRFRGARRPSKTSSKIEVGTR